MNRVYHTWDKWECYPAGFYENNAPNGMTKDEAEGKYKELLSNEASFCVACRKVIENWKHSCEHYLTNINMNRIAWMGQAALAYSYGIPAKFRNGYNLLSEEQKKKADTIALAYINEWMTRNNYEPMDEKEIQSVTVANLY